MASDAAESGSSGAGGRKRSARSQKAGSRVDQCIGVIADQPGEAEADSATFSCSDRATDDADTGHRATGVAHFTHL